MKKLFVWLASAFVCTAQAVSIGPFATETWVEDRLQVLTNDFATVPYVDDLVSDVEDKIPDVSGLATKAYVDAVSNAIPDVTGLATKEYVDAVSNAIPDTTMFATKAYVDAVSNAIPDTSTFSTVEYVNTTSNNLAILIDDLVSEEELGSSVSNIVPSWALVPVPPVTVEVDPAFTNWLATTNVVIDDNVGAFVSNVVPSWALVPIPPVTVEVDPAFTNWLATTNVVQYSSVTGIVEDIIDYIAEDNFVTGVKAAEDEHYIYVCGDEFRVEDFTTVVTNATAGNIAAIDTNGNLIDSGVSTNLYLRRTGGTMAGPLDMANYSIHQVSPFGKEFWIYPGMLYATGGHQLEFTTNGVLKAGTVATVEDLFGFVDKSYVDSHQWDWSTQVTNAPAFAASNHTHSSLYNDAGGSSKSLYIADAANVAVVATETVPNINTFQSAVLSGSYDIIFDRDSLSTIADGAVSAVSTSGSGVSFSAEFSIASKSGGSTASRNPASTSQAWIGSGRGHVYIGPIATGISDLDGKYLHIASTELSVTTDHKTSSTIYTSTLSTRDFVVGVATNTHVVAYMEDIPTNFVKTVNSQHPDENGNVNVSIALDAIAPAFSTSSVYTNGDYVIYDLHLYECTNYTGQAGWRANDWQQTTVTGILGNLRRILDAINGEAL